MNDNNIATPTDPFSGLAVAEGERFAGAGAADDAAVDNEQAELAAWLKQQTWSEFAQSLSDWYDRHGSLTQKQFGSASRMRGKCQDRDIARGPKHDRITEDGIYMHDGVVIKVQWNRARTNLYAKMLVGTRFEYAAGLVNKLTADMKMTLEQAREFGALYGVCCKCGATLTNEESIAYGIGPICRQAW